MSHPFNKMKTRLLPASEFRNLFDEYAQSAHFRMYNCSLVLFQGFRMLRRGMFSVVLPFWSASLYPNLSKSQASPFKLKICKLCDLEPEIMTDLEVIQTLSHQYYGHRNIPS